MAYFYFDLPAWFKVSAGTPWLSHRSDLKEWRKWTELINFVAESFLKCLESFGIQSGYWKIWSNETREHQIIGQLTNFPDDFCLLLSQYTSVIEGVTFSMGIFFDNFFRITQIQIIILN